MDVKVKKNLWPKIKANLSLAKGSYAAVGFPGDASKTKQSRGDGHTNIEVAVANEYGTAPGVHPVVPARPFLHQSFEGRKAKPFLEAGSRLLGMIAQGEMSTKIALERLGRMGQSRVQDEILHPSPAFQGNAKSTIAKKRSSQPLRDTDKMLQAVTYKVRMKSGIGAK